MDTADMDTSTKNCMGCQSNVRAFPGSATGFCIKHGEYIQTKQNCKEAHQPIPMDRTVNKKIGGES